MFIPKIVLMNSKNVISKLKVGAWIVIAKNVSNLYNVINLPINIFAKYSAQTNFSTTMYPFHLMCNSRLYTSSYYHTRNWRHFVWSWSEYAMFEIVKLLRVESISKRQLNIKSQREKVYEILYFTNLLSNR